MTARIREDVRMAVAEDVAKSFDGDAPIDPSFVLALVDKAVMPLHDRLVEEISDQSAVLRERNRQYGKASATIGQLRAENAMLRTQLAAARLGVTLAEPRPLRSVSDGA